MQFAGNVAAMDTKGGNRCTINNNSNNCNSNNNNYNYKACVNYEQQWEPAASLSAWSQAWVLQAIWTLAWGPGHGDKIKLNCFMTTDKRLELCV